MRLDAVAGDSDLLDVLVMCDVGVEGRAVDVLFIEGDVDCVVSRLSGEVCHCTCSISIVSTINSCLTWPFHCHTKSSLPCRPCVYDKLGRTTHHSTLQSRPPGPYSVRTSFGCAGKPVWRGADGLPPKLDGQQVLAKFGGRKVDKVALMSGHHMGLHPHPRWRGDGHSKVSPAGVLRDDSKLLQRVDGRRCCGGCESAHTVPVTLASLHTDSPNMYSTLILLSFLIYVHLYSLIIYLFSCIYFI